MRCVPLLALLAIPIISQLTGCSTALDPLPTVKCSYSWTADRSDAQIVAAADETITTAQAE